MKAQDFASGELLLAVALKSEIPDALLLNINTQIHVQDIQIQKSKQTQEQKHIPDTGSPASARYDDIGRINAQTNRAQRKFSVVVRTPTRPLLLTYRSSSRSSTSHSEELSMSDEDAESAWSQANYGSRDLDYSGDEIEATPRVTRRGTSAPASAHKLRDSSSLAEPPGSFMSSLETKRAKRVKQALGVKRGRDGKFTPKIEDRGHETRSAISSKIVQREDRDSYDDLVGGERRLKDRTRKRSSSSSVLPKTPTAIVRKRNGRFARSSTSSSKRKSTVPERKEELESPEAHVANDRRLRDRSLSIRERRSSAVSAKKPTMLAREKGKFASIEAPLSTRRPLSDSPPPHDGLPSSDGAAESATPALSVPHPRNQKGRFASNKKFYRREPASPKPHRELSPFLGNPDMDSPEGELSPALGALPTESQVSEDFNEPQIKEESSASEYADEDVNEDVDEEMISTNSTHGWKQPRNSNGKFLSAEKVKKLKLNSLVLDAIERAFSDEESYEQTSTGRPTNKEAVQSAHASTSLSGSLSSLGPIQADINLPLPPAGPNATQEPEPKPKRKRAPAKSPYFPTTPKKSTPSSSPLKPTSSAKRRAGLSCIPFPPLSSENFGLIQEKLAHDPFRLLIAVTFLIRTLGKHSIPVFFELMQRYPTPGALLAADREKDILPIIQHLGLQNQRASTYQEYARIWLENPPVRGKRYRVLGYPTPGVGKNVGRDEVLGDEGDGGVGDGRVGWEIGHMTQGPYALDSWRIFCRDICRGLADSWNGEGATARAQQKKLAARQKSAAESDDPSLSPVQQQLLREQELERQRGLEVDEEEDDGKVFQPEWMRVLPMDKELRAYLRWMWLKEGFDWDPLSGNKEVARPELMEAALEGRLEWDELGGMKIVGKEEFGKRKATDVN